MSKRADRRVLAITMGCPVGVGPEIILKFLQFPVPGVWRPLVVGSREVLAACARQLGLGVDLRSWQVGEPFPEEGIAVYEPANAPAVEASSLRCGHPDATTGRLTSAWIESAVRLVQDGEAAGLVTAPISKSALHAAGSPHPGHTEMLAALCETREYAMMMAGDRLRVTLVTIHERFASVPTLLSPEKILRLIKITDRSLRRDFAISSPRIAVAGLNPHAAEGGMFGDEEVRLIAPAVDAARRSGVLASGPHPPDTVFVGAASGRYDAVVCMYHDQGLIPFKLLHFADGVNVTVGLPIVRTSVDHGTAYDIAGQGIADHRSLEAAFHLAGRIRANRDAARVEETL